MGKKFIGTSGFSYEHWRELFYPSDLPQNLWLNFYAQHFNSVEINVTFYRLPALKTFQNWFRQTPEDFYFVLKGSRYITHLKRLHEVSDSIQLFFNSAKGLKTKLSAILWQLPSNFPVNPDRLEQFAHMLQKNKIAKNTRHVFEFRNDSWFDEEIFDIMKENNFGLCIAHSPIWKEERIKTSNFIYLRFHGKKSLYSSNYSEKELKQWAAIGKKLAARDDLYAYFNNDAYGYALNNAQQFSTLLDSNG